MYRDGEAQFVGALEAGGPALRMQVTPDGSRVAFLTSSQMTGYNSVGTRQMYTYDPATEQDDLRLLRPDRRDAGGKRGSEPKRALHDRRRSHLLHQQRCPRALRHRRAARRLRVRRGPPTADQLGYQQPGHLGRWAAHLPDDAHRPRGRQRRRCRRLLLDLRHLGPAGRERRVHQVLRRPHRRWLPIRGPAAALQSRGRVSRRRAACPTGSRRSEPAPCSARPGT